MGRRHKREAISMDLTPLIDIVFLLLIFFLVTSSFKKEQLALLLKLPKAEQGAGTEKKTEQLTIELSDTDIETAIEISREFRKMILIKLNINFDFDYQE